MGEARRKRQAETALGAVPPSATVPREVEALARGVSVPAENLAA